MGQNWAAENHGMWNACGNFVSGIVGLLLLAVCWWIAWWFLGRGVTFGRRARRRAARLFLLGLVVGTAAFFIPTVRSLLSGNPLLGPTIGCSLGAIAGMLTGASKTPLSQPGSPFRSTSS
jgi:hypothetical protein